MAKREGVMLAKKLTKAYLARLPNQVYFQPKVNGQRCRVEWINGKSWLWSSQGNIINSVPHINEQLENTHADYLDLDGELWSTELSIQEISAIARKTTRLDKRYRMLNFYIFDFVNFALTQTNRFNVLYSWKEALAKNGSIKMLDWYYAPKEDWERFYEMFTEQGYEGLIIRNPDALYQEKRTADLLKKKKTIVGKFRIVGAFQADAVQGVQVDMLGGLKLRTAEGKKFNCGAGCLSHAERTAVWKKCEWDGGLALVNHTAVIEYPELTNRGVPHQPILREII